MDLEDAAKKAGEDLRDRIKDKIESGVPPPNAASTVSKKGHDRTLIDTEEMLNSIDIDVSVLDEEVQIKVGVFKEDVALRAIVNEFGNDEIPERSFLRSTCDEEIDRILENLGENAVDSIIEKLRS